MPEGDGSSAASQSQSDAATTGRRSQDEWTALDEQLRTYQAALAESEAITSSLQTDVHWLRYEVRALRTSNSWRVTAPLRAVKMAAFKIVSTGTQAAAGARAAIRMVKSRRTTPAKMVDAIRNRGVGFAWSKILNLGRQSRGLPALGLTTVNAEVTQQIARIPDISDFASWVLANAPTAASDGALRSALERAAFRLPSISVVVPVFNAPPALLSAALQSVLTQHYAGWELCICDDASTAADTHDALMEWARRDSRIKVVRSASNQGISGATNRAAEIATGDYLVFLDQDDELTPDCLAEIALAVAADPSADIIYSDDDKIDTAGKRYAPQFKPDWSPTLLLSYMYLSHAFAVRRSLFLTEGGFRAAFDGAQDYDFALRASERTDKVIHIPKILYHWRATPGSTASSALAKPESMERGRRAVEDAVRRRAIEASVVQPAWASSAALGIYECRFPHDGPSVAILIPTRNNHKYLRRCIESLRRTLYANYAVHVLDNDSDDVETCAYLRRLPHKILKIPSLNGRFNFARMNNVAARDTESEYLLFLNDDTEVLNPEWLSQMMGHARVAGVGAVGAQLRYANGSIQHAGVIHGLHDGLAGHALKHLHPPDVGYLAYGAVSREYSAVTAACLLTRRDTFLGHGGFDERRYPVAYNDVDYCARLGRSGLRSVYCASAQLLHREGKSRGFSDSPADIAQYRADYGGSSDRYYNPNLSLRDEAFHVQRFRAHDHLARPVRTAVFSHNLNLEGAPICLMETVEALVQAGAIEPVVFSPVDGPLREDYAKLGIAVRKMYAPRSGSLSDYDRELQSLAAQLRDEKCEVVYANTLQTYWAINAAAKAALPAVWNVRESEPWSTYFDFLPPPVRARAYEAFLSAYQVVFVSKASSANWWPLDKKKNFAVIHDGLATDAFAARLKTANRTDERAKRGIETADVVILAVGTVCERKGQLDLIRALALLTPEETLRMHVYLVGECSGAYAEAVAEAIDNLPAHIRPRVHLVPETRAIHEYFVLADIFVCCSRIESYPRVILEAMAAGLPVVTTPVFGIAEQVRPGINGLFYAPGDVEVLAAHIRTLVVDARQRAIFAGNSPVVLKGLPSFDDMIRGYRSVLRQAALAGPT